MAEETYDLIIVGGGTAGLVLANRLSVNPDVKVLVLEAGQNHNSDPRIAIPGYLAQNFGDPAYDWCYDSVPQEGLDGRTVAQTRGKVLGGTSAINAMSAIYPARKMFDIWTQLGNKGWDRETIEPYYRKYQKLHTPPAKTVSELEMDYLNLSIYGREGPVQTSVPGWYMPLGKMWIETMDSLGLKAKKDPMTGDAIGAFNNACFIDPVTATRSHAGVAYWEPVKHRKNLSLKLGALVEKIVLKKGADGELVATGVQYIIDGKSYVSHARKEVILSAGVFGSPAILEMSGIGDEKLLKELGIEVLLANSNVGENLQDHPMILLSAEVSDPEQTMDSLRDPGKIEAAAALYAEKQDGILSVAFSSTSTLSTASSLGAEELKNLDEVVEQYTKDTSQLSPAQKIQTEYLKSLVTSPRDSTVILSCTPFGGIAGHGGDTKYGMSLIYSLVHPFSRGSSHIQISDPHKSPLIDPAYLKHPLDTEILAYHLLFARKVLNVEPLKSILKPGGNTSPPSGMPTTLEEARSVAKATTGTQYHPCGTCAMMSEEMGGVVGDRLVVHGTRNLRVVDASVFPIIPKGPITSSVYAVAERAADLIIEDLRKL